MGPTEASIEYIVNYFEDHPASWHHLIDVMPDGVVFVDEHGVICYANERAVVLSGYESDQLVGQSIELLVPPRYRGAHVGDRDGFIQDPTMREMGRTLDLTLLRQDGSELPIDIALAPLELDGKSLFIATIRDDTVRRAKAEARAEVQQRFRLAFEHNMAPMVFTSLEDQIVAANSAFYQMIGYPAEEIIGLDSASFTHPEDVDITAEAHRRMFRGEIDHARYVKRYIHRDGRLIDVEVSKSAARDASGATIYFIVSIRDITEEKALTAQLSHQVLHDPLTGLPNRVLFEDRLAQAHARVVRQGGLGAVLLFDLNDFKGVNEAFGHDVGDQLLVAVARRFERVTRSTDALCRFGGDEFLYLAEGLTSPEEAEHVAKRLLDVLSEPFSIAGERIEQHASVGVVVWDDTSKSHTEIIQDADVAMYEAKRESNSFYVVFDPSMHQQATNRFALIQDLRHALQDGEISMHYQPIVDLTTTEVVGFEALMRWYHPERGWVPPSVFIPVAEQSELIFELGSFALHEAVAAASIWKPIGAQASRPYVTVNLSAHQFRDPGLVPMIEGVLSANGLPAEQLVLEITESVTLLDVAETLTTIDRLGRLGIGIALDDFGTGYTSLAYLELLHPRIIKIDRSFVSPPHQSAHNDTVLEMIISLGNKLSMTLVAEGIETRQQLERLLHLGCVLGQGFLFSPAVPISEVEDLLIRMQDNWGDGAALPRLAETPASAPSVPGS